METETPRHIPIPESLRPLLWWVKWDALDLEKDQETIIVAAINEGTLAHWRWIIETYGKETIRSILEHRLESEFHPESRNLARVLFSIPHFRNAR
ncbi:MAG: hypothetical protein AAB539_00185 [Patescibacteria group bacterium]